MTTKKSYGIGSLLLSALLLIALSGCSKDTPQDISNQSQIAAANKTVEGIIVLDTEAKMGNVQKTIPDKGCPAKFEFRWNKQTQKLHITLLKFHVGAMPFAVVYDADATYSELNYWEKQEYPEKGWIKFSAQHGVVTPYVEEGQEKPKPDKGYSSITGYINSITKEIEFNIDYNMMTVTSFTPRQKIDRSRLPKFDAELAQYEKDLIAYKKANGLL